MKNCFTFLAAVLSITLFPFLSPVKAAGPAIAGHYLTTGQVIVGVTGSAPVANTLLGTSGQIAVSQGAEGGNFQFSFPTNVQMTNLNVTGTASWLSTGTYTARDLYATYGIGAATGVFSGAVSAASYGAVNATDVTATGIVSNGTSASAKAVTLTDSYLATQTNVESQTNPGAEYSLIGMYGKASTKAGTNMANVQLVGVAARADMHSNALDAYALQSHLSISALAQSAGNMTAVSGKTILADGVSAGIVTAGLFTLEGPGGAAVSPSTAYGIWADIVDVNIAAGVMVHSHGSALASGISFTADNGGAITKDITLQNAETIDNSTNGTVLITSPLTKVSGAFGLYSRTSAEIKLIDPVAAGELFYCSNCTTVPVCISTGTAVAQVALITDKTAACE